jgi:DNA segregation ATPase FtsK/SpoIIIE-like protein
MGDLNKSVNTLAGDPLERLNNSFGMIGSSILSLDFGAAQTGLQGVTSAIKDFKFGDLSNAAKGFGKTMLDLGKALLTNPIFLIGGIIALIVANFEELTKAGGLVGKMFGFLKTTIDSVTQGLVDFMDWIGLTDSKAEERAENEKKRAEEAKKLEDEKVKKQKEAEEQKEKLAKEAAKKEAERLQKIKDDQKSLSEFLKAEQEKRYQDTLSAKDKELRQLQLEYDQKKKLAHGNTELLRQLDNSYFSESIKIEAKYSTASREIKKANADESLKLKAEGLRATLNFASDEELVEEESAQIREENLRNLYENRYRLAQESIGGLMALNDALTATGVLNAKQSFKVNKALQLAQAGIGAIQAVQVALADPTLVGPSRYIAAAAAGIAGAANVAKIAAMKYDAGSTGGSQPSPSLGGGSSGGAASAPAVDLSFLNQGSNKAQPIQTYVLATNVSSAQEAEQKIKDQSKIIK